MLFGLGDQTHRRIEGPMFSPPGNANRQKFFEKLGSYFYKARQEADFSQLEASLRLGYTSISYLSDLENGRLGPDHQIVKKLIEIYGLNEQQVIDDLATFQSDFFREEIQLLRNSKP